MPVQSAVYGGTLRCSLCPSRDVKAESGRQRHPSGGMSAKEMVIGLEGVELGADGKVSVQMISFFICLMFNAILFFITKSVFTFNVFKCMYILWPLLCLVNFLFSFYFLMSIWVSVNLFTDSVIHTVPVSNQCPGSSKHHRLHVVFLSVSQCQPPQPQPGTCQQ